MKQPSKIRPDGAPLQACDDSLRALERKADEILRKNGTSVLSKRDQIRKEARRDSLIRQHAHETDLVELHGSNGIIENSKKPAFFDHQGHFGAVPNQHSASSEESLLKKEVAVLKKEWEKKLRDAVDRVIWDVFGNDKITRLILLAIMKPPGLKFLDNKAISQATGLSIKQVTTAKARMKYRVRKADAEAFAELIQLVKGEPQ
ncbi:hypothetical protein ACIPCF_18905 (plasmid) [Paracoccus marcusii]|uniref:hypothetical protein n=1 Tax=Paracoccus marcusii TaxID=59779 RepID=UPI0038B75879